MPEKERAGDAQAHDDRAEPTVQRPAGGEVVFGVLALAAREHARGGTTD
jgi:hypothetical protein